jgi:hypothetical protein
MDSVFLKFFSVEPKYDENTLTTYRTFDYLTPPKVNLCIVEDYRRVIPV